MIDLLPSSIRRRRIARAPVLVAAREGTNRDGADALVPAAETLLRSFDLAPLIHATSNTGWRSYRFETRTPFVPRRSIRIDIAHVTTGDAYGDEDTKRDLGDTVLLRGTGPEGGVRIEIERMEDLLWGMMSRRAVLRTAGCLVATAVSVLRSYVDGTGEVALSDAVEACRLASLHHHRARVAAATDDLAMLGPHRDIADFVPVWSIDVEPGILRMRPVIEKADPEGVNAIDILRMNAGDAAIADAARRCGITRAGR